MVVRLSAPVRLTVDTGPLDDALAALEGVTELPDSILLRLLDAPDKIFRIEPGIAFGAGEIRFTLQPGEGLVELITERT